MALPKALNIRLWVRNLLRLTLLNINLSKNFNPHNRIKQLEERFRKSIRKHYGMNINQKKTIRTLYRRPVNDVNHKTRVNNKNNRVITAKRRLLLGKGV